MNVKNSWGNPPRSLFWSNSHLRATKGCFVCLKCSFEIWAHWCHPMTTGGYLIKIHPKPSDSGRGVPLKGQRIFPKNAPLCLFFLGWGGLGESVPTRTPLLSTAASQRNVSMSPWPWAPRCRPNSWSFFFGTNESTDAGPLLPVTSYAYSLHVYKWAQLPSSLVGAHPQKPQSCFDFWHFEGFFWVNGNKQEVGGLSKKTSWSCLQVAALKDNSNRYLSYLDFPSCVGQEESQSFFFSPCIWVRFPIWPILLQIGWHNTLPSRGLSSIILRRLLNFWIVNSGWFFFPQLSHFLEECKPNHPPPTPTSDVHIDSFSSYEKQGFFKALFQG